jgi:hypothetical protein
LDCGVSALEGEAVCLEDLAHAVAEGHKGYEEVREASRDLRARIADGLGHVVPEIESSQLKLLLSFLHLR